MENQNRNSNAIEVLENINIIELVLVEIDEIEAHEKPYINENKHI